MSLSRPTNFAEIFALPNYNVSDLNVYYFPGAIVGRTRLAERRGVGARVVLVRVVNIGVRVDMKDGQIGVTATYCAHDRMSDGMVAAEANQWIA